MLAVPTAAQAAPLAPECDGATGVCELVFGFTGETVNWAVPENAEQVSFELRGGSGYGHWRSSGSGGAREPGVHYSGQGDGGGTFIFTTTDNGATWQPFAVAGGGSGAAGGAYGRDGGGANLPGMGGNETNSNGGGGQVNAPGLGATGYPVLFSPGENGTGPASYDSVTGLAPGAGGDGGIAEGTNGGSGGGAGGGYYGGGGGAGGIGSTEWNGVSGGGGSGYLAPGFDFTAHVLPTPMTYGSVDGEVRVTWHLEEAGATSITEFTASPEPATVGEPVTLEVSLTCEYGAEGDLVTFTADGIELGSAPVDAATQSASFAFTPATAGDISIEAAYSGRDAVCAPATTTLELRVNDAPPPVEEPPAEEPPAEEPPVVEPPVIEPPAVDPPAEETLAATGVTDSASVLTIGAFVLFAGALSFTLMAARRARTT